MIKSFLPLFLLFSFLYPHAQIKVVDLQCESKTNPLGVDNDKPRFSWKLQSDKNNCMQIAYEIRWAPESKSNSFSWTSVKIFTDQSVFVPYKGPALQSAKSYVCQVRVWDNKGSVSPWSNIASWTMGLLQNQDWKAKWIEPEGMADSSSRPSPFLLKDFIVSKHVYKALAFVTAHGMYEGWLNGSKIGNAWLTPGWTSYKKRLQYQVFDCTPLIKQGKNEVTALLGSGWYRGYIGFEGSKNVFGKDLALLYQLDIEFTDGSHQLVVSDDSWLWFQSGVLSSEIYNGEIQDTRLPVNGSELNISNTKSHHVKVSDSNKTNLIATYNQPVTAHEEIHPVRVIHSPKGETIIDFGQNMVGWVRLQIKGEPGQHIILDHAEVLDKEGNFYTDNLRSAKEQDEYILKGNEIQVVQPHFTFQGFRYVKLSGFKGLIDPSQFTGVALYSDMPKTGSFTCSNTMINQLQHNIQWGQKGNFLDVPTDCPQRDERLGWTGDAQVFSRTASFNFQVLPFFTKWLKDVAADQRSDGMVPFVVPNVLGSEAGGAAGWADVATIIPWNMYIAYGDTQVLRHQYPSMKAWVDFMRTTAKDGIWTRGNVFGDWLFYRPFDDNDGRSAVTDKSLISEAFFIHSSDILTQAAQILNKKEDEVYYRELADQIRKNFMNEFVTPSGRLVSNTQTAYVLALQFDILPHSLRQQAVNRLVQNVRDYNYHLTTGFLGTPYLCEVLTKFGHADVANRLLFQDTYPSWLYPVKMGATTIWERWDGERPDSTFETPGMNSFNHYAYGAIGDWLYRYVAGMDESIDHPGYKQIILQPYISDSLNYVSADLETNYGKLSSHWEKLKGGIKWQVTIPPNTNAILIFPGKENTQIDLEGKPLLNEIK